MNMRSHIACPSKNKILQRYILTLPRVIGNIQSKQTWHGSLHEDLGDENYACVCMKVRSEYLTSIHVKKYKWVRRMKETIQLQDLSFFLLDTDTLEKWMTTTFLFPTLTTTTTPVLTFNCFFFSLCFPLTTIWTPLDHIIGKKISVPSYDKVKLLCLGEPMFSK